MAGAGRDCQLHRWLNPRMLERTKPPSSKPAINIFSTLAVFQMSLHTV